MTALRIFIYVQHLSGVGHTVRMQRLGEALATRHRVTMLDGGRELPFPPTVEQLTVPRLARIHGQLYPLAQGESLAETFDSRAALIDSFIDTEPPDVILVEHYPFSKWELEAEILPLLTRARQANPGLKIIASLRDISPTTRHEQVDNYDERVLDLLHAHFDALLVHGDPALCTLADSFPAHGAIRLPVHHTGLIAAPASSPASVKQHKPCLNGSYVVASVGGGSDRAALINRVQRAWRDLQAQGVLSDHCLLLFGGLDQPRQPPPVFPAEPGSTVHMGFCADFRAWLSDAALSISCAGYNTCADLLATCTPALLIPNTTMSDQRQRAQMLDQHGMAILVPEPANGIDTLGQLITQTLEQDAPQRSADLGGAEKSLQIIEGLLRGA